MVIIYIFTKKQKRCSPHRNRLFELAFFTLKFNLVLDQEYDRFYARSLGVEWVLFWLFNKW